MSNEATITVTLTVEESAALRMASIFGGPDVRYEPLEEARRKLRAAELIGDARRKVRGIERDLREAERKLRDVEREFRAAEAAAASGK